jgi:hypothetical protein
MGRLPCALDRHRQGVVGAVRKRVAVDDEQRLHSVGLQLCDRGHQPIGSDLRGLPQIHLPKIVELDRRPVCHAKRPSRVMRSVPEIAAGINGTSALQRDTRRASVRASLVLLHEPLLAPRALGKDRHDLTLSRQSDGCVDRDRVAFAASHGKRAAELEDRPQGRTKELHLRHESNLPLREQRQSERPRIEVRQMVRREDVAPFAWKVLRSGGP